MFFLCIHLTACFSTGRECSGGYGLLSLPPPCWSASSSASSSACHGLEYFSLLTSDGFAFEPQLYTKASWKWCLFELCERKFLTKLSRTKILHYDQDNLFWTCEIFKFLLGIVGVLLDLKFANEVEVVSDYIVLYLCF